MYKYSIISFFQNFNFNNKLSLFQVRKMNRQTCRFQLQPQLQDLGLELWRPEKPMMNPWTFPLRGRLQNPGIQMKVP